MEKKLREIYTPGSGQIIEKKSRFIADVFSVRTEEEVASRISEIKKKHYDARHHCFAYVLGDVNAVRASDDGEPSGTAGKPMLEVLVGEGLLNTLVIVTRYFGGTLLGTGGLTRAYREATKEGLKACVFIERCKGHKISVTLGYELLGKLENLIRENGDIYELDTDYGENVTKVFVTPTSIRGQIEKKITEISSGGADIDVSGELDYGIAEGRVIWL